jgi:hypothetical protein
VTDDLLTVADELYALPLDRFTPARDARAKELKGSDLAAPVKALRKPSLAAWVVNLFVRRDPEQVEQVLAVGAALREAQEGMDGAELRALTKQRRQLTSAVTARVRSLAAEEGVKVTQAVADQVEATLTAAMLDVEAGRAVRSGLLVAALSATGVDAVDAAAAVALPEALGFTASPTEAEPVPPPDLHVVPDVDADAKARTRAEDTLAEAEQVANAARGEARAAEKSVADLEARSLQLQAEIDELKRQLSELEERAEETDDELSEAEETRDEAAAALKEAEQSRDRAQKALDKLS